MMLAVQGPDGPEKERPCEGEKHRENEKKKNYDKGQNEEQQSIKTRARVCMIHL